MIHISSVIEVLHFFPTAQKHFDKPLINPEITAQFGTIEFKPCPDPCRYCQGRHYIQVRDGYEPCPMCGDEWSNE